MVAKCANPRCEHRFRYVSEGRLYVFGRNSLEQTLWLCPQCAADFDIILDGRSNPVLAARSQREPGLGNVAVLVPREAADAAAGDNPGERENEFPQASLVEWTVGWLETWEREHTGLQAVPRRDEATEWNAGAICRLSGVHAVIHHHHRPAHRAVIHEGEMFPSCRSCGTLVSFQFLQPLDAAGEVEHIGYDHDFVESLWGPASIATA